MKDGKGPPRNRTYILLHNIKKNKISVWGLGSHALNNIIPAIYDLESIELYGVYSRNKSIVDACCEKYGCKTWDTPDQMLQDNNLDTVMLTTPTGLHYEQGLDIINAKKHFWCDKTLSMNYEETEDLINLSKKFASSICEGFMFLYHPHFEYIKSCINNNEIGEVISLNCRFGLPPLENPGFRLKKELGASCLHDVGSYSIVMILELFAPKKVEILNSKLILNKSNIDVGGYVLVKIEDSIMVYLEWYYDKSYRNDLDIWGSKGSINTYKIFSKKPNFRPIIFKRGLNGSPEEIELESSNHFTSMFDNFNATIDSNKKKNHERASILKRAQLIDKIKKYSF